MKSVRVRLGVVGGLVGVLVAAVGSASAKPNAKPGQGTEATQLPQKASKLDPVWVKGLTPTLPGGKGQLTPVAAAAVRDKAIVDPSFVIKRLTPEQRGEAMGTAPAAIQGPLVFDARNLYHDDEHYMELLSTGGSYTHVRTKRNYLFFSGATGAVLGAYEGAYAELHFTAAPRTRYLLECAVEAGPAMTIRATDDRGQYSVSTSEKASLLYRRDNVTNVADPVMVRLAANYNHWYLDRCELSWTPLGG